MLYIDRCPLCFTMLSIEVTTSVRLFQTNKLYNPDIKTVLTVENILCEIYGISYFLTLTKFQGHKIRGLERNC